MKKFLYSIIVILSIVTTSCCITTHATSQINKVEIGMDRAQIKKLLGTPEFKNGDNFGEQWCYHKMVGDVFGPEERLFVVTFDKAGKVIAYDTYNDGRRFGHARF